ncbi:MarR family winged helix-turn-helix transcriptional regulator [Streptomyces sp. NPDC098781]|uniref:MarR family winged helix-turn-helix transcriptional regulator n=1 Tax=Streptomyces sp. NPDC098781 TaxID=3366097 RepID=UPI0037F91005
MGRKISRASKPMLPSDDEQLSLDWQICFTLNGASRAFAAAYRTVLKDVGLTYPQYLAMVVLWEHGELPVMELGRYLRLDSGTMSPLLKRLEATGFIRRERSLRDQRSVRVRLTEAGIALRERTSRVPRRITAATDMDLSELAELRAKLERLTDALDAAAMNDADTEAFVTPG